MKFICVGIYFIIVLIAFLCEQKLFQLFGEHLKTTGERLADHGYHSEDHTLQTDDGYLLQMTRIIQSPMADAKPPSSRPVVLFCHGMFSTADTWIISLPEKTLAYMLADAGFDVWLGNLRGNRYTRRHTHHRPNGKQFWQYNLHELGHYDLTAMMDYALNVSGQGRLHFIGDSQGCTVFFIAMASRPEYNAKVKTSHHLSPLVYQRHSETPFKYMADYGFPAKSLIAKFLTNREFLRHGGVWNWLCHKGCREDSFLHCACRGVLGGAGGGWNISQSLVSDFCDTHPAGSSSNQMLHLLQMRATGKFQRFDFGHQLNVKHYGLATPTEYDLSWITSRVYIYCSDMDYFSQPLDNEYLARQLPNASVFKVLSRNFNHYDSLWGEQVRELLYEPILQEIRDFEIKEGNGKS